MGAVFIPQRSANVLINPAPASTQHLHPQTTSTVQDKECLLEAVTLWNVKEQIGEGTSMFTFLFSDSVSLHCAQLSLLVLKPLPISCQDLGPVDFSVTGSARESRISSVSWNNSLLVMYLDWLSPKLRGGSHFILSTS